MESKKYRAVVRRCYLELGQPRVGREVVGLYTTRNDAERACTEFVKSQGDRFRADYDSEWQAEAGRPFCHHIHPRPRERPGADYRLTMQDGLVRGSGLHEHSTDVGLQS